LYGLFDKREILYLCVRLALKYISQCSDLCSLVDFHSDLSCISSVFIQDLRNILNSWIGHFKHRDHHSSIACPSIEFSVVLLKIFDSYFSKKINIKRFKMRAQESFYFSKLIRLFILLIIVGWESHSNLIVLVNGDKVVPHECNFLFLVNCVQ